MTKLTGILGALALASFGCGNDEYVPADADIPEETAPAFVFEGNAAYCKSHSDEMSTCLEVYANMRITAVNDISLVWTGAYIDAGRAVKISEEAGEGSTMNYTDSNEICIRGNVTGVSLFAEDVQLNQGEHTFEEIDCETIERMMNQ